MDGTVLSTVTGALLTGVPEASPSKGVAVQISGSPESKLVPSIVCVVTDGLPSTVHDQV